MKRPAHHASHLRSAVLALLIAILAGAAVASCDDFDPEAMSDGMARLTPTPSPVTSPEPPAAPEPEIRATPVEYMRAPRSLWVYFTHGGDVWRLPFDGPATPLISGRNLLGTSPSASGDRIAAMVDTNGPEREYQILRSTGDTLVEFDGLDQQFADLGLDGVQELALSPRGDRIAFAHMNGAVSVVDQSGNITVVIPPEDGRSPGELRWSPDGGLLAYLDPWMPAAPSSLYVVIPESGIRQIIAPATAERYGIVDARWIPGTTYLAYVSSSSSTAAYGGDLFAVDVHTGRTTLLMASGEFAPVAGIVDIAPSPDGRWVAATIFVPGSERPQFNGLWLLDLDAGDRSEVPVDSDMAATDLWWLGRMLVYRVVNDPRSSRPGLYTGVESYSIIEVHPETGSTRVRHDAR